ncbi:MAG TPA: lactonase family protein [Acetobacteraceae bacterium]|nr:lactonase family protein [Acetobacteraceae bacterium]
MAGAVLVYVGTYTETILFGTGMSLQGKGEGIYVLRLDPETGALDAVATATGIANPSFLAFDATQRFLYAVNELKSYQGRPSGSVSAFAVDPITGTLALLNRQPTHGTDPCHVVVDSPCKHVFVANFMSGSICVLPVNQDGSLGPACDFVQHVGAGIDPVRQTGPHAHSITLDAANRFVFVPDLGLDKVLIYRFDAARGMLEPSAVPWLKLRPGSGPRHLAAHPNGPFAYLANELSNTATALAHDAMFGVLRELQTVSTLPAEFHGNNGCADIHVHPSGRFIYVSNRGHDSIASFGVDPATGHLTPLRHTATLGRTPRSFCIDPSGKLLIVANQDSDLLVTFRIDPATGALQPTGHGATVPTPVCVRIHAAATEQ